MADRQVFMKVWEVDPDDEEGEVKELWVGPFLLENLADALMTKSKSEFTEHL